MTSATKNCSEVKQTSTVNVAIAVIHYKEQYLLGFRNSTQHQGNLYEFVGGKIDDHENAEQAVVREVAEETGIDLSQNTIVKLGRVHHDYGDKQVSLQIYKSELSEQQYEQHQYLQYGLEQQPLKWVERQALLAGKYPLPAANNTILEWIKLPTQIAITYPLAHFSESSEPATEWLNYHIENLSAAAWVYIRVKGAERDQMVAELMNKRPDLQMILPYRDSVVCDSLAHTESKVDDPAVAYHLTHTDLMQWDMSANSNAEPSRVLCKERPFIVSCHDIASIEAANRLADARIEKQLPPVMAIFVSPVLSTKTHPDAAPLGWESWSELAQLADMPVIGLGGLSPSMIGQAAQFGGVSVAGIRQFL